MTHLKIQQNNIPENVTNAVIEKLYDIVSNESLDESSDLSGLLYVPITYRAQAEYLTTAFPNLTINAGNYAIPFEDPAMVTYLNSIGVGSDGMVTEAQAAAATVVANSTENTVTKFNELKYFTNITTSKGGISGGNHGNITFAGWTALEEVDISNFTSLGHDTSSGLDDTFRNCTSLKKVIASNKLTEIGYAAFNNCSNLEDIIGLSGTIDTYGNAFSGCTKLKDSNFTNVLIIPHYKETFKNCSAITTIALDPTTTIISDRVFNGCTALITVSGLSNVTSFGTECFTGTNLTTHDIDWTKVTSIGGTSFYGTKMSGNVNLSNITTLGDTSFSRSDITSMTIGGTITAVPGRICENCTNLNAVSLSNNITAVGVSAFGKCSSLSTVSSSGTISTVSKESFNGCSNLENITFAPNLTVGQNCFQGCTKLKTSNFNNVAIQIYNDTSNQAFYGCTSLTQLTLSTSGTPITSSCFYNCTNLTTLNNSNYITKIGSSCFQNCSSLTSLNLPSNVTQISGTEANFLFDNCTSLTTLGNETFTGITTIGQKMFRNCSNLEGTLSFPNVTNIVISNYGCNFLNCQKLKKLAFGKITTFGSTTGNSTSRGVCTGCTALRILDLGDSITSIYAHNCYLCSDLKAVVINTSTPPTFTNNVSSGSVRTEYFYSTDVDIYVPDAAVSTYQSASGWNDSSFSGHIKPMSQYNESTILPSS